MTDRHEMTLTSAGYYVSQEAPIRTENPIATPGSRDAPCSSAARSENIDQHHKDRRPARSQLAVCFCIRHAVLRANPEAGRAFGGARETLRNQRALRGAVPR